MRALTCSYRKGRNLPPYRRSTAGSGAGAKRLKHPHRRARAGSGETVLLIVATFLVLPRSLPFSPGSTAARTRRGDLSKNGVLWRVLCHPGKPFRSSEKGLCRSRVLVTIFSGLLCRTRGTCVPRRCFFMLVDPLLSMYRNVRYLTTLAVLRTPSTVKTRVLSCVPLCSSPDTKHGRLKEILLRGTTVNRTKYCSLK